MAETIQYGQVIPIDQIPRSLFDCQLTDPQRDLLSKGESVYLKDMVLQDGSLADGSVQLKKGDDSEVKVLMFLDEHQLPLQLPHKILGHILTEEETRLLRAGSEVGPINYKGDLFKIKIDPKLNRVIIKTEKQIGLISQMGGYTFTDSDKKKLLAGQRTSPRIFRSKDGLYFLAQIELTPARDGIIIHEQKIFDKKEDISSLIEIYNTERELIKPQILETNNWKQDQFELDYQKTQEKAKINDAFIIESYLQNEESRETLTAEPFDGKSSKKGYVLAIKDNIIYKASSSISEDMKEQTVTWTPASIKEVNEIRKSSILMKTSIDKDFKTPSVKIANSNKQSLNL
jgi:hypothetical protein